ncbi:MAG: DNA mismatch repair endonuclease MutL [Bacteroidia bacterium]|nr:DNA mismatch repair endonuclease MutL [Bacteroidia bacterium]
MSSIIRLLPDAVANQIAAGEVIQRPASAVKELLENAIDAGASKIRLILKDSGRTLIHVIDNGSGMNEQDARMCFERHATSKLRNADDLFKIRTKGFRGEALASIASIAQVELKTKTAEAETGTCIIIEGNEIKSQEACSSNTGTSLAVKNLFYNVPARRNFLKSDNVEYRHVLEEFHRVAIAHPETAFTLIHNGEEELQLPAGTLRQRLSAIYGGSYHEKLMPVEEETTIVRISGLVSKPVFARKTRGEQFFFINNRYIKSPYLHHAVQAAFEGLIPPGEFVSYFLFLSIDPSRIDVNIHPTKTEVKFEDDHHIYSILRSAVKNSIGKFNLSPTLDFEQETGFQTYHPADKPIVPPTIKVNPDYNPFSKERAPSGGLASSKELNRYFESTLTTDHPLLPTQEIPEQKPNVITLQLGKYILSPIRSGLMIIQIRQAHERILFERILSGIRKQKGRSQQLLFPQHFTLNSENFLVLKELEPVLRGAGYDLNEFGKDTYVIHGIPPEMSETDALSALETLIAKQTISGAENKEGLEEHIAAVVAAGMSMKDGRVLRPEEMEGIIDDLFACEHPALSPSGRPTLITLNYEEIAQFFER